MDEETPESVWDNMSTADLVDQKDYDGITYHIEVLGVNPDIVLLCAISQKCGDVVTWINSISNISWEIILGGIKIKSYKKEALNILKWYILLSNISNIEKYQTLNYYYSIAIINEKEQEYLNTLI